MAHQVETMAYANEVPWHGLGNRVEDKVSIKEMQKAAGLDWRVHLLPLQAQLPDGGMIEVPGRYALSRDKDNRIYSITGEFWKPLQNEDMLGFMREYVDAGGATLETAGSLREGRIVWGLARLNHNYQVSRGDQVQGYLLITSPHEVGKAITVRTTSVRVVCANTLAMAERSSSIEYRQNHLKEFDAEAARRSVAEAHEWLSEAEVRAKRMRKIKLGVEDAIRHVYVPCIEPHLDPEEAVKKPSKKISEILKSLTNAPGAEPGTGWGVYNAVTHWADHVAGNNRSRRMYRSWMGDTGRMKTEVEKKVMELS